MLSASIFALDLDLSVGQAFMVNDSASANDSFLYGIRVTTPVKTDGRWGVQVGYRRVAKMDGLVVTPAAGATF